MIRHAKTQDLPNILEIFDQAKQFMKQTGNPTQWDDQYPNKEIAQQDIVDGTCYVYEEDQEILAVFTLQLTGEPYYEVLREGKWHYDEPYGTIHRMASNGKKRGLSKICIDFCKEQARYMRIDTHENNKVMQHIIKKEGFQYCGIVEVPRWEGIRFAYDFHKKK